MLLLLVPAWRVLAQEEPLRVTRIAEPIVLDGMPDEEPWSSVPALPLTQMSPVFRGEPTERTELRVAYDDDYLYAAAWCYDSSAADIRASSLTRDRSVESDDAFTLLLDTFNDNENALVFSVNPAGTRTDMAVFNDAQFGGSAGGMPFNESWNTFWDAETHVTDEGWFAEIRIPLSSIRFQDATDPVTMGLTAFRYIARKAEIHAFPEIPPRWLFGYLKPSASHDVVFQGLTGDLPLYVTPYALGGGGFTDALNDAETAYVLESDAARDIGLDVKVGLTSNLTLDLTANTDFAQVEADDAQINLTRFSLFFPEKRLFFQERSSIFDLNTGGPTRLFYSRRIGLTEDGDPVRLYGGARLVGRVGGWDVGLMNMQTAALPDADVPRENHGVYRFRRRVLNPHSYAGGMVTTRLGADGGYNTAYGVDAIIRPFGEDYVTVNWIQTFDDETRGDGALRASLARLLWERRSMQGFAYSNWVKWVGPDYEPGLGFNMREDFVAFSTELSYGRQAPDASRIFNHNLALSGEVFLRGSDGTVETVEVGPNYFVNFKSGAWLWLQPAWSFEELSEVFELDDDVSVPVGSYRFTSFSALGQTPTKLIRAMLRFSAGSFYDGWRITLGAEPVWNVSRRLELGGEVQINRVGFPERELTFSGDVARLRLRFALNPSLSAGAFVQFSSVDDRATINVRGRYNPREGSDLYLVYNEGLNTNFDLRPRPPRTANRTLLVKYTYTFVL